MKDPLLRQRELVAKHPTNELARFSLGKALFDQELFTEALEHFSKAITAKPDWMMVHILIGKCHLSIGNIPLARSSFQLARELAIAQHHDGPLEEMDQLLEDLGDPKSSRIR